MILAGAPLAGLASRIQHRIPVPVVDQMAAAVKQAEALVGLRFRKAVAGTFRHPDAKSTIGLPEASRPASSGVTQVNNPSGATWARMAEVAPLPRGCERPRAREGVSEMSLEGGQDMQF